MILFWLLALLLVAVALAFVLPPLLRRPRAADTGDDAGARLAVYRSRSAALEEQHRLGALGDEDLGEARDELARELLRETTAERPEPSAAPAPARARRAWLAIAVGLGVPILAVALYQHLGTPQAVSGGPRPAELGAAQRSVQEMVAGLAARLASEPDDSEGWLLLGRSYMALERYSDAFDAYSAAHRLLGDSPALLTDMAEASALANRQNFVGVPGDLLERALALDPTYPKALWLGAFAAEQRGEAQLAQSRWRALLERQPEDSEAARVLRGLIAGSGATPERAPPGEGKPGGARRAPALTVNVTLADTLGADLDGSEALYVFARAADGPSMPLAVARASARDLPLTVTLDDSMAMAPGHRLSDAGRVIVGARIAVGGTATRSSGDLQGFSKPVPVSDGDPVRVVIDQRVP